MKILFGWVYLLVGAFEVFFFWKKRVKLKEYCKPLSHKQIEGIVGLFG